MSTLFADIALPVPLDQTFTYLVPPDLHAAAKPGCRVLVPFGRTSLTGVIVSLSDRSTVPGIKPIRDVLDRKPTFSAEMLSLTHWIAEYYLAPWGEVLKTAVPQGMASESKRIVRLSVPDTESILSNLKPTAKKQRAVINLLAERKSLTISQLQRSTNTKSIYSLLHELSERGWIAIEDERPSQPRTKTEKIIIVKDEGRKALEHGKETNLTEKQEKILREALSESQLSAVLKKAQASLSIAETLRKKGLIEISAREVIRTFAFDNLEAPPTITLNAYQKKALDEISAVVEKGQYRTFLLHGITGSGKTQVYIEVIRKILPAGKTAIVLVPEISLTPQIVRRFKSHFGDDVAVFHSQMSAGERYDTWRLARDGKIRIVIGPRSAVFAPLPSLGLIVVDEEHEASYKQFDATPRYHARDVAIKRANDIGAVVILGSATPSAESYANVQTGKYTLLELPERVDGAQLPRIEVVDMTKERVRRYEETKKAVQEKGISFPKRLPTSSISKLLQDHIAERLEKKEGVILLQNRRGFSHVMECFDCGHVEKCDRCDVTLTFHAVKKHLRCHYCGFVKKPPTVCPNCQSVELRLYAFGTQQVEEELSQLFPKATIVRMDLDTTGRKGSHDRMLQQFARGEADILLGTQMVAKGLDFPRVTLVGVISADTQMLLPDFRASERTFQLLTQVAGRAGRSTLSGEVIIQTLQPDHYSLKHVVSHDFPGFYKEELEYRKELDYPPFSRLVLVEFKGQHEEEIHHHAKKFASFLLDDKYKEHLIVLGPADAAIPRIRGQFRKHVVIKGLKKTDPGGARLRSALTSAKQWYARSALGKNRAVQMAIDVDPVGMM
ncbi:MAG TPA: primosomal protein N' [Bacteroidota bacterium]|nr:primosomal protein N' [Bacteroidota bacterium]